MVDNLFRDEDLRMSGIWPKAANIHEFLGIDFAGNFMELWRKSF